MPAANSVWKFTTPLHQLADVIELDMPARARVVSAVNQREALCVYAECDPGATPRPRKFRVAGTGHPLDLPVNHRFIDTVVFHGGDLVFHVYELGD